MATLNVALVQMRVKRADPEENLRRAEIWMSQASGKNVDLVCFPEMWTTGFDWHYIKQEAARHAMMIDRIAALAKQYRLWVNGTTASTDGRGQYYNTSILFSPEGRKLGVYSKTHLFSFMHEDDYLTPGSELTLVDAPWGRTGLSVCYDIRFPELFRTYALKGAKLVLSPMAFPHPRLAHWKILVRARAIENQMFMIGTNQVGTEPFSDGQPPLSYFGSSVVIDPWGETLVEAGTEDEQMITASLDLNEVDEIRNRMHVFQDRRTDLYELQ